MNEYEQTAEKLAIEMSKLRWGTEPDKWFERISELDLLRTEGSRITTARKLIENFTQAGRRPSRVFHSEVALLPKVRLTPRIGDKTGNHFYEMVSRL